MSEIDVVDVEVGQELEVRQAGPVTLFGTDDPAAMIKKATAVADALMGVVRRPNQKKPLVMQIGGNEYLRVEAWTCLGSLVGVFPVVVWTKEIGDDEGWEARVEARTKDGAVVGAAEASCMRAEKNWKNRDEFALRSMAQTRAMGKALRMPLGFVAVLAGFDATPAEEMPDTGSRGGSTEEASSAPPEYHGDPGELEFPAGPHKGQTLRDVYRANPGYVEAVAKSAKDQNVRAAAQAWLEAARVQAEDPDLPF